MLGGLARDLQPPQPMRWKTKNPLGRFTLSESIEIDEGVESVFAHWRLEDDDI